MLFAASCHAHADADGACHADAAEEVTPEAPPDADVYAYAEMLTSRRHVTLPRHFTLRRHIRRYFFALMPAAAAADACRYDVDAV